jgi:hypothetical protein
LRARAGPDVGGEAVVGGDDRVHDPQSPGVVGQRPALLSASGDGRLRSIRVPVRPGVVEQPRHLADGTWVDHPRSPLVIAHTGVISIIHESGGRVTCSASGTGRRRHGARTAR